MDLGTVTKKLTTLAYRSKQDFVNDLNLIWQNCIKFNADLNHVLCEKALSMREKAEKLISIIPNITIRDRAEIEAEEWRLHDDDINMDKADDSDDEPIIYPRKRRRTEAMLLRGDFSGKPSDSTDTEPIHDGW